MSTASIDSGISRSPIPPRRKLGLGNPTFYESLEDVAKPGSKARSTLPDSTVFQKQLSDAQIAMADTDPQIVQHADMLSIDEVIALSQPSTPRRAREERPRNSPPARSAGSQASSQKSFQAVSKLDDFMNDYEDDIMPNDSASMRAAPRAQAIQSQFSSTSASASASEPEQDLRTPIAARSQESKAHDEPSRRSNVSDPESEARSEHAQLCSSKLSEICQMAVGEDQDLRLRVMTLLPQVRQIIGSESRKSSMSDADDPFVYRATPAESDVFGTAYESLGGLRSVSLRSDATRLVHGLSPPPTQTPPMDHSPAQHSDIPEAYPTSPTELPMGKSDRNPRDVLAALAMSLASTKGRDFGRGAPLKSSNATNIRPVEPKQETKFKTESGWAQALVHGAQGLSPGGKDDLRLRGDETRLRAEIIKLRSEEGRLQTVEARVGQQLQDAERRVQELRTELARTRADLSRTRTRTAGKVSSLLWTRSEVSRLKTARSTFETVFE